MASRKKNQPAFFEALPGIASLPQGALSPSTAQPGALSRDLARAAANDALAAIRRLAGWVLGRSGRRLIMFIIAVSVIGAVVAGVWESTKTLNQYAADMASPAAILGTNQVGTTILDDKGNVLYRAFGAKSTSLTSLNQLPNSLQQATLAAEDNTFYSHSAISLKGTARAAWVDITHMGTVEGGSTITQQLVKNALLNQNKSFVRKFQEVLLAEAVAHKYTKKQILDMYLGEIYYGEGAYGVQAASETYFHKPANQLDLSQSALLAGIPQQPTNYDPALYPKAAEARRDQVLQRMQTLGWITAKQSTEAQSEPVAVYPEQTEIQAPDFVFYVLAQLRQKYGVDELERGGLTVKTTLDLAKQNAAQQIVQTQIAKIGPSHNMTNAGLIALNPKTGAIISMVGSVNYNQPQFGSFNVTTAELQPGSSIKPIAYVTAFEKGWNGATKIDDTPLSLPGANGTTWTPMDDDDKFRGSITIREALANSLNIPAVRTLQFIGMNSFMNTAHLLGVQPVGPDLGLSVVLGGGDVRPIDMAAAYGAFANGGYKVTPFGVSQVINRSGHVIFTQKIDMPQVLDPRYVSMITSILSDNQARTMIFGANSPLKLDRPAAAKTGTTTDYRDNWTIGYTPSLVTAVWAGNNNHTPMIDITGIDGAAPIWHDYMEMALAGTPVENFTLPAGVVSVPITSNGCLASAGESGSYNEIFISGTQPTSQCINTSNLQTPTISSPDLSNTPTPTPTSTPAPSVVATPTPSSTPQTLCTKQNPCLQ